MQPRQVYPASCAYDPRKTTGPSPLNSLYWHFIDRHRQQFESNPHMALALRNWAHKDKHAAVIQWAQREWLRLTPGV